MPLLEYGHGPAAKLSVCVCGGGLLLCFVLKNKHLQHDDRVDVLNIQKVDQYFESIILISKLHFSL